MSLYNLPNATEGVDTFIVETVAEVPLLMPFLLLFVFFVVFLGGISRQKGRTGTADYPMWAIIAGIATFMISLISSTVTGIIRLDWLIINVIILIFAGVWFFLDQKASEV